jgi:hypothetical protein
MGVNEQLQKKRTKDRKKRRKKRNKVPVTAVLQDGGWTGSVCGALYELRRRTRLPRPNMFNRRYSISA